MSNIQILLDQKDTELNSKLPSQFEVRRLDTKTLEQLTSQLGLIQESAAWQQNIGAFGVLRPRTELYAKRKGEADYRYGKGAVLRSMDSDCLVESPAAEGSTELKQQHYPEWLMTVRLLFELLDWASHNIGGHYAGVLLNQYPNLYVSKQRGYGQAGSKIAAHSDDEHKSYDTGTIVSISIGAPRTFIIKSKGGSKSKYRIRLETGMVILMKPDAQRLFTHEVAGYTPAEIKEYADDPSQPWRYNLTLRPHCGCDRVRCTDKDFFELPLTSAEKKRPNQPNKKRRQVVAPALAPEDQCQKQCRPRN